MFQKSFLVKSSVIAVALILFTTAASEAQRPGGGIGGFGGPGGGISKAGLLRSEQVQKELNVSEDQLAKINKINEESRESARELFSGFRGLRDLPQEEREKKMTEMREKMAQAAAEVGKKIDEVLTSTQIERLDQIILQQRGASALGDEAVAKKLGLSGEQQEKIKELNNTSREMTRELFQGIQDVPREERRAKFEELGKKRDEIQKETESAILDVLTASQKTQFEDLKGKAFELERRGFGFGFGNRDRRRDGDGNRRRPGSGSDGNRRPQNNDN